MPSWSILAGISPLRFTKRRTRVFHFNFGVAHGVIDLLHTLVSALADPHLFRDHRVLRHDRFLGGFGQLDRPLL